MRWKSVVAQANTLQLGRQMSSIEKVSQDQLSRAVALIIERVKNHDLVTYKAFGRITGIESPESTAAVLRLIAEATHKRGCGLANVIVRRDDGTVGYGFFLSAAFLGHRIEPHHEGSFVLSQTYEVFSKPALVESALTEFIKPQGPKS
jgi:hypothetical protein